MNFLIANFMDNIFVYTLSGLRDRCNNSTKTLFTQVVVKFKSNFLEKETRYRNCLYELFDSNLGGQHFCPSPNSRQTSGLRDKCIDSITTFYAVVVFRVQRSISGKQVKILNFLIENLMDNIFVTQKSHQTSRLASKCKLFQVDTFYPYRLFTFLLLTNIKSLILYKNVC